MIRKVTMTEDHFRQFMKAAYEDGFDDGQQSRECDGPPRPATDADWWDSVTYEAAEDMVAKARDGVVI